MAQVYALHEIELKPGASEQEFEQFMAEQLSASQMPGVTAHLIKGDRGKRAGQYGLLWEFDTVETRNRFFPTEGSQGEGGFSVSPEVMERWASFSPTNPGDPNTYTDYIVVDR